MGAPCPDVEPVLHAGKIYDSVQVGSMCWLQQNLDLGQFTIYKNGQGFDPLENNGVLEKWCAYDDPATCADLGAYYTWREATGWQPFGAWGMGTKVQGICPVGWHITRVSEWEALIAAIGSSSSSAIKATPNHTEPWNGVNSTGLTVVKTPETPASTSAYAASFFTSDHYKQGSYWRHHHVYVGSYIELYTANITESFAMHIRCVKD